MLVMKLLLLCIAAASAVTVYRSEDSMAMESNDRNRERERRQRGSLTYADYLKEDQAGDGEQPEVVKSSYALRQRHQRGDESRKTRTRTLRGEESVVRPQKQQSEESQEKVKYTVQVQPSKEFDFSNQNFEEIYRNGDNKPSNTGNQPVRNEPPHFENIHQNGGNKFGYSSYVQHHGDEKDGDGTTNTKKQIPKSSVQIELYHNQHSQPIQFKQQVQHKEAGHSKLKNKPPKFYQDNQGSYKKPKPSFQNYPAPTPSIVVQELSDTSTSSYTAKYRPTTTPLPTTKRRPAGGNELGLKDSTSYSSNHGQSTSSTNQQTQPIVHIHSTSHSVDNKAPSWKALSESVDIATSGEFPQQKTRKTRRPKEISPGLFSTHTQFFDEHERYKADRFDHEKALKGSTSFNINNAVSFSSLGSHDFEPHKPSADFGSHTPSHDFGSHSSSNIGSHDFGSHIPSSFGSHDFGTEVKQTTLEGGSAFHIAHSQDITKAAEAQLIGSGKGPIQFGGNPRPQKLKSHHVNAGSFEIPVMTEEEFEKHFGKYKHEPKPEIRFKPITRLPFDARASSNKLFTQAKQHQAQSFAQFGGAAKPLWAQSQNIPVIYHSQPYPHHLQKQNGNVEMFPALTFQIPNRRNVSILPERHGRVLSEDSAEPQQFSVSASYQIDRNHRVL